MFGNKNKPVAPASARKCPIYTITGTAASPCLTVKCTLWRDEAGACAFNVIARVALRPQ